MSTPTEHLARAARDAALAARLRAAREYNWAVTVTFYAALHEVGALLSAKGVDTETLTHIETLAKLDRHFPGIAPRCLALQGMSKRARYFPSHHADDGACRRARQLYEHIAEFGRRIRDGSIAALP